MKRMHKSLDDIEAALHSDLDALVSTETLESISAGPLAPLDIPFLDLDLPPSDFHIDCSSPPIGRPAATLPTTGSGKSVRVSIRLPAAVIEEFKKRAVVERKGYQTLIVRALRAHLARAA